ncbi:MAG: thiamine phosphate synthase [Helicobacteraceae bacterium]|nr:thiamine phosphate synthase [Helicobacteraceae bacterium]
MILYALCDQDSLDRHNLTILDFLKIVKNKNAEIIQYRNKNGSIAFIRSQLIALRKHYDGFLIVNDKYELFEYCDGIHLGQEDLYAIDATPTKAITILRKVIGEDKLIGISTHSKEEITITNALDINYVGLGAYRTTKTKDVGVVLGDKIEDIASTSTHPVAAIGGVKLSDKLKHINYLVISSDLYEN